MVGSRLPQLQFVNQNFLGEFQIALTAASCWKFTAAEADRDGENDVKC